MIGHYDLVLNLELRQRCLNIDVSCVTMYGNTGGEVGVGQEGPLGQLAFEQLSGPHQPMGQGPHDSICTPSKSKGVASFESPL